MEPHERQSALELLHHERYTPQELAELLDMSVQFICQAAFRGELRAQIVGHDVVGIRREDMLAWLEERG